MDMKVRIVKTFPASGNLRAIASVTMDDCYAVHGLKIFDSAKGPFVSMPNIKVGNRYVDTFHAVTKEAREQLVDKVMEAWQQQTQSAVPEPTPEPELQQMAM